MRLVQIAAIYMMLGLLMGLGMAIGKDYTLATVHSHLTLMGWMTMGIAGLIYRAWPELESRLLARWHFWLHNLGLPVMMASLALKEYGHPEVEPIIGIGSIVVMLGLLLFTINLLKNGR
jgi:cbb3-type cytochrome oxidase subunit 1